MVSNPDCFKNFAIAYIPLLFKMSGNSVRDSDLSLMMGSSLGGIVGATLGGIVGVKVGDELDCAWVVLMVEGVGEKGIDVNFGTILEEPANRVLEKREFCKEVAVDWLACRTKSFGVEKCEACVGLTVDLRKGSENFVLGRAVGSMVERSKSSLELTELGNTVTSGEPLGEVLRKSLGNGDEVVVIGILIVVELTILPEDFFEEGGSLMSPSLIRFRIESTSTSPLSLLFPFPLTPCTL